MRGQASNCEAEFIPVCPHQLFCLGACRVATHLGPTFPNAYVTIVSFAARL
jgi:hypothetical protein